MKKIYFVDGVPGVGKTSLAQAVERLLLQENIKVKRFEEHNFENPIDVTRKAFLSQTEYNQFLEKCISISEGSKYSPEDIITEIESKTLFFGEYAIVSYLQPYFANELINEELCGLYYKEICNGLVTEEKYMDIIYTLFLGFANDAQDDYTYIFDGALLQNILLDVIGFYDTNIEVLKELYFKLLTALSEFNITVLFLNNKNIETVLKETDFARSEMNWLANFEDWIKETNWFKDKKKKSNELNAVEFSSQLQDIMIKLIASFSGLNIHYINARYKDLNLKGII